MPITYQRSWSWASLFKWNREGRMQNPRGKNYINRSTKVSSFLHIGLGWLSIFPSRIAIFWLLYKDQSICMQNTIHICTCNQTLSIPSLLVTCADNYFSRLCPCPDGRVGQRVLLLALITRNRNRILGDLGELSIFLTWSLFSNNSSSSTVITIV